MSIETGRSMRTMTVLSTRLFILSHATRQVKTGKDATDISGLTSWMYMHPCYSSDLALRLRTTRMGQ